MRYCIRSLPSGAATEDLVALHSLLTQVIRWIESRNARLVNTNVSWKQVKLVVDVHDRQWNAPLSINENRYMTANMGMSLMSTFRHSLRSSSGVRVGGEGRVLSPPKSKSSDASDSAFSERGSLFLSSDMLGRGTGRHEIQLRKSTI